MSILFTFHPAPCQVKFTTHFYFTDLPSVFEFLSNSPIPLPNATDQDNEAQEASRMQTRSSVKHQLDLIIRECVKELIEECKDDRLRIKFVIKK